MDYKNHWNKTYTRVETQKLGWYEENPKPSLDLISECSLPQNARILNVGAGSTSLVDELLIMKFSNLIANDISEEALQKLQNRIGNDAKKVEWIVDDIINPSHLDKIEQVDLWIDRAVLHFFNDAKEQEKYFELVDKLVKQNGFVIIAVFNLNGAEKCSGLPVYRYDLDSLKVKLGERFQLKKHFDYTYTMPAGGAREYVYTLFERVS